MNALRFSAAAFAASSLVAALGSCGPNTQEIWACIDPATGKLDSNAPYDPGHYVNGAFDPCHCYDPGGPAPQCPNLIVIDAGADAQ